MKVELIYGTNSKNKKVINILLKKNEKKTICSLIDAESLGKMRKSTRDKLLLDIQSSLNSCIEALTRN